MQDEYGDLCVESLRLLVCGLYEKVVDVGDQQDVEDLPVEPDDRHHHLGEDPQTRPQAEHDAEKLIDGPPPPEPCLLDSPLLEWDGKVTITANDIGEEIPGPDPPHDV